MNNQLPDITVKNFNVLCRMNVIMQDIIDLKKRDRIMLMGI